MYVYGVFVKYVHIVYMRVCIHTHVYVLSELGHPFVTQAFIDLAI